MREEREIEIESKIKISIALKENVKTRGYIYHYVNKQEYRFLKKKILPCLPKISMGKQQGLTINKMPS